MGMMMRGGYSGPPRTIKPDTAKRVARSFLPYKPQLALITVAVLISAALGILPPFFLQNIVNRGLLGRDLGVVTRFTIYTLCATFGTTGFSLWYSYLSIVVGQRIMRDLRNNLFDHLQGQSLRFFTQTRTGEIQSRLANDVGGIQSVVSDTAANVLSNVTIVLSTLVAMLYLDWRLTILSVGILPFFVAIAGKVGGFARDVRTQVQRTLADLNSTMQETLSVSGVLLTKTTGRRALTLRKFEQENEKLTDGQVRQAMIMRYFFNLIGLTFSVTPVLVYWLAGYLIVSAHDQHLTLGRIVAFTALQSRLFFPLTGLLNVQVDVTSSLALFDRIFEYLDLPQDIKDAPDAKDLDIAKLNGDIEFKNVMFRYNAESVEPTVDEISFRARPGDLVALVGHSGSGKTTITYLIPRLYDVESGSVSIDGNDVRSVTQESLARAIGVVTQETYLVHDTIRANLRYGRPDATDAEMEEACRAAAIHDHISKLPDGYDTVVGERGYKLSGGEKQRVAIARAILKNPRILILDEATSALDTQSERVIQSALNGLMEGRTTVAIAHRLSTIISANLILVLDKGRILERGTHEELLALGGRYSELHAAQFKDESIYDEGGEPVVALA